MPGWSWLGQVERDRPELAREAAQTIRQMAEGESLRQSAPRGPWAIAGYVMGGLLGLPLLILLFSVMLSALFR